MKEVWDYGDSSLTFFGDKLAGWKNASNLHLIAGSKIANASPLTLGSKSAAILASVGTPSALEPLSSMGFEIWQFGNASLFLQNSLLIGWINYDHTLPISLTSHSNNAQTLILGSSKDDVISKLGTPAVIYPKSEGNSFWAYDTAAFAFDSDGFVSELASSRFLYLLNNRIATGLSWPLLVYSLALQSHLDYHSYFGMTSDFIYPYFAKQYNDNLAKVQNRPIDLSKATTDKINNDILNEHILYGLSLFNSPAEMDELRYALSDGPDYTGLKAKAQADNAFILGSLGIPS